MWKAELMRAVQICGGQTALAAKLSELLPDRVDQGHVGNWLNRDKKFQPRYCLPIQYVTGGRCKASKLCPDAYPAMLFDDLAPEQLLLALRTLPPDSPLPARATG